MFLCSCFGCHITINPGSRSGALRPMYINILTLHCNMERQINIYSNIYTYLQIVGPRYKSFIPIFKSFVPSFKSFIPRYK